MEVANKCSTWLGIGIIILLAFAGCGNSADEPQQAGANSSQATTANQRPYLNPPRQ